METPYDLVHYEGLPVPQTHPDRLAAAAALRGLSPPSPETARILELGCGDGTNLVSMAYHMPEASFLGVDLSAANVARAEALAAKLGLGNVSFLQRDIAALGEDLGAFDYVVAHGVLSWVPEAVEARIWALLRDQLRPEGVAFLSYNTHPGWQHRRVVRDILRLKLGHAPPGKARCDAARALCSALAKAADGDNPYGSLLRGELAALGRYADHYIEHEYFSEESRAFYFGEIVDRAARHGLAVAGELTPPEFGTGQVQAHRERLSAAGLSGQALEEYVDVLCGRQFRATVFCHAEPLARAAAGEASAAGREPRRYYAAPFRSQSEEPLLREGRHLSFELPNGVVIGTESAVLKAALLALGDAWPLGRTAGELLSAALAALRERGLSPPGPDDDDDARQLREDLEDLVAASHIELRFRQVKMTPKIDARPRLHALARLSIEQAGYVATPRHEVVALARHGRAVALLCDGTRDLDAIVAAVLPAFVDDPPRPEGSEQPVSPADLAGALPGYVAGVVLGLGRAGAFEP